MYEACEDAIQDGVTYLELRFSPELHRARGLSLTQVMAAVCEGMAMASYRLPKLTVRVIVCGMRHRHLQTKQLAEIAWRYRDYGAVAFDLAGPEEGYPSKGDNTL